MIMVVGLNFVSSELAWEGFVLESCKFDFTTLCKQLGEVVKTLPLTLRMLGFLILYFIVF